MWAFLMLIAMLAIYISQVYFKDVGLCFKSYIFYSFICLGITGWVIPLSYEKAPSFFQPYFLSIAVLTILGFLGSKFYYNEVVTNINYLGAFITIIGTILIVK